eukprot:CAMPEP_0204589760 /NCGR_PEP_ID=MMETSP0661-20131031/49395_1 /ASSEMBLY_ACC=CAM_ASM_000606 /TAXON_ID=109239 /ORGANISM="Alexandrium margalefi, Strain AMGDE01CS-322" /LENGTH=30 /DNA_ID= /DNA_START= /DNA_END= /DNA_ORIENTATION=
MDPTMIGTSPGNAPMAISQMSGSTHAAVSA